ncbi:MAG TPA: preprotein translocase subunit SecG [Candidatus Saccharimonadales bacterium]|nr:preprotein translocase subunit SecG [Candidatus Saccharimonadales bacterium]
MLQQVLIIAQIIVAVLLIASILLQAPEEGLSPVFGGGGEMYRSKRNVEKFLVISTIVLAILLVALSIALLLPQIK